MIFKNKTLLVTGGSRGIGKKICYECAQKGCDVIFTYVRSSTEAKKLENDLKGLGVNVISKKLNLNSTGDINKFSNDIKKLNIKINFLINNAASGVMKNSIDSTEKHWDWTMQINAKGPWILSKEISEIMPKNSRIINISSPGSTKVLRNYFSIGVSKFFPILKPKIAFEFAAFTLSKACSIPLLLNPILLIKDLCFINLKSLGFMFPFCALGVSVPNSMNPKPR